MKKTSQRSLAAAMIFFVAFTGLAFGFDFTRIEKEVKEKTLDNGLKIIVLERHDAPVASFVTLANVGGCDDPKGYSGLAHMFEHMAFKGTRTIGTEDIEQEMKLIAVEDSIYMELRSERLKGDAADEAKLAVLEKAYDDAREASFKLVVPNEFSQIVEREGGVGVNAGTSKDFTVYMMSYPSNKTELWMRMESDRFKNPVLREMYKERDVIMEERHQVLESSPFGRTLEELLAAAFKAHPYGISIIGHESDIRNYTREKAMEYYKEYYVPENLVVCIVGDVKSKDIFKMAEKYWGDIPHSPKPEQVTIIEPEQKAERRILLEDPSQPLFTAGFHIPAATHPDFPIIEALADHLGQGRTSLLYKKLVKEKKTAAQVGVYVGYPASKYPTFFLVYAIPTPGSDVADIEADIWAELEKIKSEPLPAEEVEKIKSRARANFIFGLDSNMGMAMQLAIYQTVGGNWHEMFANIDRINAITAEDIQRVANEYFGKQNRTVAIMETASK